jgi:hypothetical protein
VIWDGRRCPAVHVLSAHNRNAHRFFRDVTPAMERSRQHRFSRRCEPDDGTPLIVRANGSTTLIALSYELDLDQLTENRGQHRRRRPGEMDCRRWGDPVN